ncbi:MAG: hypothetical protein SGJ10_13835 [Bacteroidota bacterium]|nr:hypothetical protein [Bacteroidota bacterium]
MKSILYIILGFILATGCTKPDPLLPPTSNTSPEFFIKGQKNVSDSIYLAAGDGGMYMYSQWEQSSYNGVDSCYQFKSSMAPVGCSTCNPRFNIIFVDSGKTSKGQNSYIDNFVKAGNFSFINPTLQKGGVYINWVDSSGTTYSSRKFNFQPASANFKVASVENYKLNNGIKTKKVKLNFTGRCYNTLVDYTDFINVEACIVIGYP